MSEISATIAERRNRLAKFLQSIRAKQVMGTLKRDSGYCVMGAACEQFRKETGEGSWSAYDQFRINGKSYGGYPPPAVRAYYGWTPRDVNNFISANDSLSIAGEGKTFSDFASMLKIAKPRQRRQKKLALKTKKKEVQQAPSTTLASEQLFSELKNQKKKGVIHV